jgi:hypothetical protein
LRAGQNELQRRAHRAEVGADVDHVGENEKADQRVERKRRVETAHIGGDALARHTPDLGADHLDRAHERIGEKEGPGEGEAEGRAGLRVGGDPARVVVRSAGYQAWTENVGEPRPVRPLGLTGGLTVCDRQSRIPFHAGLTVDNLFRSLAFRHVPRVDDRAPIPPAVPEAGCGRRP